MKRLRTASEEKVIRIAAGIKIGDRAELLVRAKVRCERALFDSARHIARRILRQIGGQLAGIYESAGHNSRRDERDRLAVTRRPTAATIRAAPVGNILLHDQERWQK